MVVDGVADYVKVSRSLCVLFLDCALSNSGGAGAQDCFVVVFKRLVIEIISVFVLDCGGGAERPAPSFHREDSQAHGVVNLNVRFCDPSSVY